MKSGRFAYIPHPAGAERVLIMCNMARNLIKNCILLFVNYTIID